jgi:hypothetical protein
MDRPSAGNGSERAWDSSKSCRAQAGAPWPPAAAHLLRRHLLRHSGVEAASLRRARLGCELKVVRHGQRRVALVRREGLARPHGARLACVTRRRRGAAVRRVWHGGCRPTDVPNETRRAYGQAPAHDEMDPPPPPGPPCPTLNSAARLRSSSSHASCSCCRAVASAWRASLRSLAGRGRGKGGARQEWGVGPWPMGFECHVKGAKAAAGGTVNMRSTPLGTCTAREAWGPWAVAAAAQRGRRSTPAAGVPRRGARAPPAAGQGARGSWRGTHQKRARWHVTSLLEQKEPVHFLA